MRMMRISLLVCCLCCLCSCVSGYAQDRTQRPLPFPDKNIPGTSAQRELLRQLRAFLDQKQQTEEGPVPASPDENSPGNNSPGNSGLDPSQLGQLGEALQKLKDQLPPGVVPPNLGEIPPEKLQKALSSPEAQQRMRKLLEQFQRDGLLPPSGAGINQPPLPVPPGPNEQNSPDDQPSSNGDDAPSLPDKDQNRGRDIEGETERRPERRKRDDDSASEPNDEPRNQDSQPISEQPDQSDRGNGKTDDADMRDVQDGDLKQQPPKVPIQSLKALEDFLQELSRSANGDRAESNGAPVGSPSQSGNGNPSSPSAPSSPSGNVPNPRQPLRRRDPSANPAPLPRPMQPDPSQEPSLGPQPDPGNGNRPVGNAPPNELNRNPRSPNADPSIPQPGQNEAGTDPSGNSPSTQQTDRVEQSQKAMETLQQLLQNEALRRQAEQMLNGEQPSPGAPVDPSNPLRNRDGSRQDPGQPNQPRSPSQRNPGNGENVPGRNSDASQGPDASRSASRNDGSGTNPSNGPGEQSIEEFLREQMKKIQSQPQPPSSSQPTSPLSPRPDEPRPSDRNAQNGNPANRPGASVRSPQDSQSNAPQKPPIDIAEEVNRRGLKDTLKKIWDNAKEESRREKDAASGRDVAEAGSGVDLNEVPADRLLKMLDNFSEDLEKLAKESERSDRSERPGRVMPEPPRRAPEPPSALSELRKSASEWLSDAVPTKPSQDGGLRSEPVGLSMPSLSAEFDTTPALILAVLLGLAGLALFAGKIARNRAAGNSDAALAALGPPLTPEQIHDRSDVVRAFHQVALKGGHAVEDWWNHRDAALSLAASAPQKESAVSNLASVYEHARYLPEDVPLTPDKIESARAAVRSLS